MVRTIPRAKSPLTHWQRAVLADYASGYQLKEVATRHYVSYKVVLKTTEKIKNILGAKHLGQAIIIAYTLGYLSLPDENGGCSPRTPWEDNNWGIDKNMV